MKTITIAPFQRQNLAKLCLYMASLPPDYGHFDMAHYYCERGLGDPGIGEARPLDVHQCGTSACLLGHGPNAGIDPLPGEMWSTYPIRVFGCGNYKTAALWDWLFHPLWDNSIPSAIKRMAWYLQTVDLPEVLEDYDDDGDETLKVFYPKDYDAFVPDMNLITQIAHESPTC